jgi:flagellar hook-basal body complex protein FliE
MVDKIANPAAAANAYANMAKISNVNNAVAEKAGQPSFGQVLKGSLMDSISTMKHGETMSARAVTGEASLPDVVQAVNAAELTLQTVVAVRDRLITAYQEIMRTQI